MGWAIVIEEVHSHVCSDEATQDVDDRREQGFDCRGNGWETVSIDTRNKSIQVNVGVAGTANAHQCGMLGLGARERSGEQRIVSVVANGTPQILRRARAYSLHRRSDCRRPVGAGGFTRQ
jgi:hypothetical protein